MCRLLGDVRCVLLLCVVVGHIVVVVCCLLVGVCHVVLCLLFLIWLVVTLRGDMLRLTLRGVADMCCDVVARCCALFGFVGSCGTCVLNVVVWCCRVLCM